MAYLSNLQQVLFGIRGICGIFVTDSHIFHSYNLTNFKDFQYQAIVSEINKL